MKQGPEVKIISCNRYGEEVCASAARISTTQGDAVELFASAQGNPQNGDLIQKVLKSGHKSVIEHAVFTLAFRNVSVFVEQYLIECRLASFTVKSRRYVDFGSFGYYIPSGLEGGALDGYCRYMDLLFSAYRALLEAGVPKEDARFVLPYSFHSNFYCTLNARELLHVIRSIRFGRGRGVPELRELAGQLTAQLETAAPFLLPELEEPPAGGCAGDEPPALFLLQDEPRFVEARQAGAAELIGAPPDPIGVLRAACRTGRPWSTEEPRLEELLASQRPRELEQLSYSFRIPDVTLSGITHLVRHRMQSVLVPPIQSVDHGRYIAPESVREGPEAWDLYRTALDTAHGLLKEAASDPLLERYGCYFAVSGNLMAVMTTMNARELELFIRLRTCSRAQWEIRNIAVSMLRGLREHAPALFDRFGPSCYRLGRCPEGKLTCGRMAQVCAGFSAHGLEGL